MRDEEPSTQHAHVLSQAARLSMLAGDSAEAVELAGWAVDMADAVGAEVSVSAR